ncbi:nucleotidyltransferase family protein [Bacillus cereus]|nr:nucleotidyltransferase family protein [Bacillus cereus]
MENDIELDEDLHLIDSLLEISLKEKLFPTVYKYLDENNLLTNNQIKQYGGLFEEYLRKRESVLNIFNFLCEKPIEFKEKFLALKGIGMELYYPKGVHRQFSDLDMCVENPDSFWEIGDLFLKQGFDIYSTMNLCSNLQDLSKIFGSARYEEEESVLQGVEIQVGRFPVTLNTYISWDILQHNKTKYKVNDDYIYVPSCESSFILMLGEFLTRPGQFYLRDIIDILHLTKNLDSNQIDFINHKIEELKLYPSLSIVENAYKRYNLEFPDRLKTLMKNKKSKSSILTGHIFPFLKQENKFKVKNLLLLLFRKISYTLNDNDKFLLTLKKTDEKFGPMIFYSNGQYVYFMKLHNYTGEHTWITINNVHFLVTPVGTFIGCMHALYSDEELEMFSESIEKYVKREENVH